MYFQSRILVLLAGLLGATGVALSAVAAHRGGANLGIAASFLLAHAPALLAMSMLRMRFATFGALVLFVGLVLFCGDLAARDLLGAGAFPYSAPSGGVLMIAGWLIVAGSAFGRTT